MTQFGKYQIEEQLGIGSMGVVYRARDTILDREVALKTIRAGPSVEPEVKERFYREARACARLQHPHIVTVYDLGEIDDNAYISMELLTGEDLRRTIESRRSIPVAVKISLIAQVGDALGHAHRNDVVHRDIKPSNIFILTDNSAKVLDFGVARLPSSKLTLLGRVLGTPNYMAPEQIQGNPCDARSDLFSLALVFYELLTGSHPFRSDYIPRSIVTEPPASLRRLDPKLPAALEDFFDKALQKRPNERFQRAEEFSEALRSILDGTVGGGTNVGADQPVLPGQPQVSATSASSHSGFTRSSSGEGPTQPAVSGGYNAASPSAAGPAASGNVPASQAPAAAFPSDQTMEWRTSEFFRLMQECEKAIESRSPDKAKATLKEMKDLAALDPRFNVATLEYERQVNSIEVVVEGERKAPASIAQPVPSRPGVTAPTVSEMSSSRHSPAAPPAGTDWDLTRRFSVSDAMPPPASPQERDASDTTGLTAIHHQPPPAPAIPVPPAIERRAPYIKPPDRPPRQPGKSSNQVRTLLIIGCAAIVVLGIGAYLIRLATRSKALPAVGTAIVTSDRAALFAGPNSIEKRLTVLAKGSKVNITRMPQAGNPEWIAVQQAGKNPGIPGYVHAAVLGHWSTLSLLRLFDPGESATVDRRSAYAEALRQDLPDLSPPEQKEAWLEVARQDIAIAHAEKAANADSEDWKTQAQRARDELARVSSDGSFQAQAQSMEQDIAQLLQPPPAPPQPREQQPPTPPAIDTALYYKWAEDAYRDGAYDKAIRYINSIRGTDSNYRASRSLLELVLKAKKEEEEITSGVKH